MATDGSAHARTALPLDGSVVKVCRGGGLDAQRLCWRPRAAKSGPRGPRPIRATPGEAQEHLCGAGGSTRAPGRACADVRAAAAALNNTAAHAPTTHTRARAHTRR